MNYSSFNFKDAVDRLQIEIRMVELTSYRTVRNVLKKALVECMGFDPERTAPQVERIDDHGSVIKDQNEPARVFRFWIQEPNRFIDIKKTLDFMDVELSTHATKRYLNASSSPFSIHAIELSFDAQSKSGSREEMIGMVAHMYHGLVFESENTRLYKGKNDTAGLLLMRKKTIREMIADGFQIGIGNRDDDVYHHLYFKTTDDNGTPLHESLYRARVEVTLQGAALPFKTLEELHHADFRKLFSQYFRFRKVKDDFAGASKFTLPVIEKLDQVGRRKNIKRRFGGGVRKHHGFTEADRQLSDKARNGLHALTSRWKQEPKAARKGSRKHINEDEFRANLVNGKALSDCFTVEQEAVSNNYISSVRLN